MKVLMCFGVVFFPPRWRRLMFVVLWINNILYCTRRVCCCWRSRKAQSISSLEFSTPKPDRLPTTKCLATVRQLLSLFPFISSQPFNTALKAHFYNVCIWKRLCWYTFKSKNNTIYFFYFYFYFYRAREQRIWTILDHSWEQNSIERLGQVQGRSRRQRYQKKFHYY